MGKVDTITKQYMEDNQVFADAFNYLIYDGKEVIQPEQLHFMDSVKVDVPYGSDEAELPVQKVRDELKYLTAMTDEKAAYVILGIENQDKVHYAMPVKNMVYDALEYAGQIRKAAASHRKAKDSKDHNAGEYLSGFYKSDRLLPVITLVVFFSADQWDGPLCLHDMLSTQDEEILTLVENYRIHLIEPANLSEQELDKFHSSLKEVLSFIKYSTSKKKLERLVGSNEKFAALDKKAAMVINACTNSKLKIDTNQEVIDMCRAIAEMRNEAMEEGHVEGVKEANRATALRMIKKGVFSHEVIAEISGLPVADVKVLAEKQSVGDMTCERMAGKSLSN